MTPSFIYIHLISSFISCFYMNRKYVTFWKENYHNWMMNRAIPYWKILTCSYYFPFGSQNKYGMKVCFVVISRTTLKNTLPTGWLEENTIL